MSKKKMMEHIFTRLNLQRFGFTPFRYGYTNKSRPNDLPANKIEFIKENSTGKLLYRIAFFIVLQKDRYFFDNTLFKEILFDKVFKILAHSKMAPLQISYYNKNTAYDVTSHPDHIFHQKNNLDPLSQINFCDPSGMIDDAQLDRAIAYIHQIMETKLMPFFDAVSSIEVVNREIIDRYEDDDWDNLSVYIPGDTGIKKLIFMKLGNHKNFDNYKNWYLSLWENSTYFRAEKILQLLNNILLEFDKMDADPHYFDVDIPDDTFDSDKPNAAHIAAAQRSGSTPKPEKKRPRPVNTRFTDQELDVIQSSGMDAEALDIIHDYKIGLVSPSLSDAEGDEYPGLDIEGISYAMDVEGKDYLRDTINPELQAAGYKAYITAWPDRQANQYTITIIPRGDDMDILRYQYTNGINHGLGPDEIINKLKTWRDQMHLSILGAGHDWVAFTMSPFPVDLDDFISELIAFCPDYIQQDFYSPKGPEHSKQQIKEFIRQYGFVRLWWD